MQTLYKQLNMYPVKNDNKTYIFAQLHNHCTTLHTCSSFTQIISITYRSEYMSCVFTFKRYIACELVNFLNRIIHIHRKLELPRNCSFSLLRRIINLKTLNIMPYFYNIQSFIIPVYIMHNPYQYNKIWNCNYLFIFHAHIYMPTYAYRNKHKMKLHKSFISLH
jgi:hypothetical protein